MSENTILWGLGVAQTVFFGLVTVIWFFVRGLISDLKQVKTEKDQLDKTIAVLQTRMDVRDGSVEEIKRDVKTLCEDMRWMRDRIQRLPCRQEGWSRERDRGTCDPD